LGTERIDGIDIKRYYAELVSLPLMGQMIRELFDLESRTQANQVFVFFLILEKIICEDYVLIYYIFIVCYS
jgi:hypothetical protein